MEGTELPQRPPDRVMTFRRIPGKGGKAGKTIPCIRPKHLFVAGDEVRWTGEPDTLRLPQEVDVAKATFIVLAIRSIELIYQERDGHTQEVCLGLKTDSGTYVQLRRTKKWRLLKDDQKKFHGSTHRYRSAADIEPIP